MQPEIEVSTAPFQPPVPEGRKIPWAALAVLTGLLVLVYFPVLQAMAVEWIEQEEMGHGVFVVPVAAYVAWSKREELLKVPVKPSWWALSLVVWGFLQMMGGFFGADFFISRTGFYLALLGVIWTVTGGAMVKALAFPLFLLLFMIRMPLFIYSQITFPLQIFASSMAEHTLGLIGIPVLRDGNVLELASQRLSVVEACSGIRSLLSLSFLSLVYGHFFDSRGWMKWVLLVFTIPIAILANAMRVTLTGILSEWNKEFAQGAYHTFEGWVIFMVALSAMVALHFLINRVWAPASK
jgi:exosortase